MQSKLMCSLKRITKCIPSRIHSYVGKRVYSGMPTGKSTCTLMENRDKPMEGVRLNLGSNDVRLEGFLNVDIRMIPGCVDIVDDVLTLGSIKDDSVEAIIAHNILEHVAYDKTEECLNIWVKKLKKGGSIEIGVPDGEFIFERYRKRQVTREQYRDCPWKDVIHSIFGNMELLRQWHGEDAEKYMHHTLFCESFLRKCMEDAGIKSIVRATPNHPDNVTLRGIK